MNNVKKYTGIVLLIFLVFFKIQDSNFVMKVENIAYDAYQSLFIKKDNYDGVVIVDIDEKSIGEIGQFPWRRDVFAKLIDRLNQYQASVIAFDIFFSEEDKQNPKKILEEFNIKSDQVIDSDQSLLESIKGSNVVLAVLGDVSTYNKNNPSKPKTNIISRGMDISNYVYSFKNKITSLEKFNDVAAGIGTISYLDSPDAVLRSVPIILKIDGDIWPALSLESLRALHGHKSILINSDETGINSIKTRKYLIEPDPNAIVYINYKEFDKKNYIPAVDVLNMSVDANKLKDKIVIIGSSAQGLFDFVKIPNGDVIPGVQTHAHLIENIVNNDFIIKNLYTTIAENLLLIISLILVLIIPNKILPKFSIIFFSGLVLILIAASMIVYQFNYFVDVFYIISSSSILFLTTLYFRYLKENELALENEKKQIVLKQEREIAGEVQKKLFPKEFTNKDLIFAKNVPAKDVSGDYYDYISINNNEVYFTLADVSGKGVKAGILMANAAAVFRSMAKLEKSVSSIAQFVNNQVANNSYQGMFITAVIGKFNIDNKEIEYINLGHEPIMIFDKEYKFEYLKSTLPPLGIMSMDDESFFQTNKVNIQDKNLMIYTDGVTEGYLENGEELQVKGLEQELINNKFIKPTEIIEHISKILTKRNAPLRDDVTCIVVSGHNN
ncbi:CHASE2 domain-containing protein [Candidatus Pelagibacter communis]|uniref:CHASE2 domain-containing protein n=1 Tax=Candidatus Pelagibacter TaxID=198251 RepID=UPI003EE3C997